ncbi:TPA: very short patch repair endonuclease [Legionella pneumophila]|uniref:very short patch repair endonuclease n=1 Tax=Legionella pneumophila TaxID=446 RepID=UPI000487BC17|nr:DNA mismatch endonuclease Vsr [Legionella pneumophila]HAT9229005.1 DNA mismatch endonuclease Vsr [Legionella pneumophila subsp. pneumophila]MCZ4736313.1 DNA mismatch endonuclease Vsr [Legionella pneumophila]MDW9179741.1 DNA mismatch endonuclease Vsr [Legionella pneumophila]CZL83776.1 Very short patch repair protein [Legionella pneumophila]HAT9925403.1 DNA mismatch endonuclease Vsr [Legionella pneumophila subsp. pneumophila]
MTDKITPEHRSRNMAAIKNKNTRPELEIRSYLFKNGFRYRLHRKDLPGKPDLTLTKYKTVIFINGCFWHRHTGCKLAYTPKSNIEFWEQKFHKNVENDLKKLKQLEMQGWKVIIIWECEIKNKNYHWLVNEIKSIYKTNFSN